MDLFGVVSFIHDIEVRMSASVTLFQEFFGVRDIMDRMLGYLQTGDNLLICIHRDRCFQEPFSGLTGSPGIVVAGVRAGKPGRIYGGAVDPFTPVIEHFHKPVKEAGKGCGSDPLTELMDCREMGNIIEVDLLSKRVHDLSKFYRIPVIFRQVLFQEKKNE
jgi:hypothetical protein